MGSVSGSLGGRETRCLYTTLRPLANKQETLATKFQLMDNKELRTAIFDLLAFNLQLNHFGYKHDIILCPVCLRELNRHDLQSEDGPITLGHIIPEHAGGKFCVLECKLCNSKCGTRFESQLAKERKYYDFFNGNEIKNVKLQLLGQTVNGTASKGQNSWHLHIDESRSDPKAIDAIHTHAAKGISNLDLSITIDAYNKQLSWLVLFTLHISLFLPHLATTIYSQMEPE